MQPMRSNNFGPSRSVTLRSGRPRPVKTNFGSSVRKLRVRHSGGGGGGGGGGRASDAGGICRASVPLSTAPQQLPLVRQPSEPSRCGSTVTSASSSSSFSASLRLHLYNPRRRRPRKRTAAETADTEEGKRALTDR